MMFPGMAAPKDNDIKVDPSHLVETHMGGPFFFGFVFFFFFTFFGPGSLAFGFWLFLSVAFGGIFGMSNLHTFQYTSLIPLYLYLNLYIYII